MCRVECVVVRVQGGWSVTLTKTMALGEWTAASSVAAVPPGVAQSKHKERKTALQV